MRIAVGADDAGAGLAAFLVAHLRSRGIDVEDHVAGEGQSYPDVAVAVARRVADGTYGRAILVCGTGIGMSIAANKVPGVCAALCHDTYSAERARLSNNAQVQPGQVGFGVGDLAEPSVWVRFARSTQPLSLGLRGGRVSRAMPRSGQAAPNSAMNSDPPRPTGSGDDGLLVTGRTGLLLEPAEPREHCGFLDQPHCVVLGVAGRNECGQRREQGQALDE